MSNTDWIKELVRAEQQMEASDMVDFSVGFDAEKILLEETNKFLGSLKDKFVDCSVAFNQMKGVSAGNIRIYGIANTHSDFMLFRNGFKLIFTMKRPGQIAIRFQHQGSFFPAPSPGPLGEGAGAVGGTEEMLDAQWGAFGELNWVYQGHRVNPDYLVRYYLSTFIRDSAK